MALSVSVAAVRAKCRILDTEFDTEIQDLIDEQLPVIEYAVLAEHIANTGDTGLQATLNLGATEIIAGEFLAQTFREPGVAEEIQVGELTIGNRLPPRALVIDPYMLKEQGWKRLSPYLKPRSASERASRTTHISVAPELSE
jgi:hypothetical protein